MNAEEVKKIQEFFDCQIDSKEFAKHLRRLNHVIAVVNLDQQADINNELISESFHWVNNFAEILDPYLTKNE